MECPSASIPRIIPTVTRIPRIQGLPPIILGLVVIRSRQFTRPSFLSRRSADKQWISPICSVPLEQVRCNAGCLLPPCPPWRANAFTETLVFLANAPAGVREVVVLAAETQVVPRDAPVCIAETVFFLGGPEVSLRLPGAFIPPITNWRRLCQLQHRRLRCGSPPGTKRQAGGICDRGSQADWLRIPLDCARQQKSGEKRHTFSLKKRFNRSRRALARQPGKLPGTPERRARKKDQTTNIGAR